MTTTEAWVISLQERPDRLAAFRARATAANLDVNEWVVPRSTKRRDGWGGSPGASGCAESHLRLLAADTGPLLVFEDDAMIGKDLLGHINLALLLLPRMWDLCLLGSGGTVHDKPGDGLGLAPIRAFALTHAYLVSERGRPALAECARRASGHWDHFASRRMCARGQVYGYVPSLVNQDPALGSDIP